MNATEACHACRGKLRPARRSRRWGIDIGSCGGCGTTSVLDAPSVVADELDRVARTTDTDWAVYSQAMNLAEDVRADVLGELRSRIGTHVERPTLFDVGAGTGSFLDMARSSGFEIRGNDISRSAIEYAASRYGITVSSEDLARQAPGSVDALTMWCVLAHVGDPAAFLASAHRVLRPGGVLFVRTPRRSAIDVVAEAIARSTNGRFARIADQRVTRGHLHLFSDWGMARLLARIGFVDVEVLPVVHSMCTGTEIATRLGGPAGLQRMSSRAVDSAMRRGMAPRNTMFVYARRAPAA